MALERSNLVDHTIYSAFVAMHHKIGAFGQGTTASQGMAAAFAQGLLGGLHQGALAFSRH